MTKCKSELSVTERMIIQLIKFRTGNERHPTFFGNNENIAKCIDIQPDTARKAVAKLIKLGYLKKHFDKQGRRHLIYTNKEFVPIIENMNNIDKKVLKNEKEYYEAKAEYATKELNLANIRIEHLEKEAEELRNKLFWANLRIKGLENIFTSRGLTREQIEILIKETQDQANVLMRFIFVIFLKDYNCLFLYIFDIITNDNRHYEQIGSEVKDISDEIPFDIPNSWEWCRLVDITKQIHYGYTASAKSEGNIKLLRITDIQNNSVCWNNVPFCEISEKELLNYKLSLKDILIARTGGTVGKSYIIKDICGLSVFASYLIRLIPIVNVSEDYIKLFLESSMYWKQLKAKSMGTGQPNVNGEALKSLLIPLPPYNEQIRISNKVENALLIINEL